MTHRIFIPCFVFCILVMLKTNAIAQEDPMEVFKPLMGNWMTVSENRPSSANPEKTTGSGELNVRTILDGRFVQSEGYGTSPRIGRQDYHVIMTYDERQQNYRRWMFRSDGVVSESKGVWDADKKTMTWSTIGLPANTTFTVTTTITEDGFQETLQGKRPGGAITMDVTLKAKKKR